jgi:hypothetical protein
MVLKDYFLQQILYKLDMSRQLVRLAIELGEYGLLYHPRPIIKGQVMTDFIAICYFKNDL